MEFSINKPAYRPPFPEGGFYVDMHGIKTFEEAKAVIEAIVAARPGIRVHHAGREDMPTPWGPYRGDFTRTYITSAYLKVEGSAHHLYTARRLTQDKWPVVKPETFLI